MNTANMDVRIGIIREHLLSKDMYLCRLTVAALIGLAFILARSRFGVDLSDDTWYTADPYFVSKGSVPYTNNWTQASGFTLPLFVCHTLYSWIAGKEGIFLFTRFLYCLWKTLVLTLSFVIFKKAKMEIPAFLIIPLIVFVPEGLYAINYNSIGLVYVLLCFSIVSLLIVCDDILSAKRQFFIAIICGIIMGRCVIGTPITIVVCFSILIILFFRKRYSAMKGYIAGGIAAAALVVGFCWIRGGIKEFFIGIQYFFKDISYYEYLDKHQAPLAYNIRYSLGYFAPAICAVLILVILKLYRKKNDKLLNNSVILMSLGLLCLSLYYISGYAGTTDSVELTTKFGWFIPIVCSFYRCSIEKKKKLQVLAMYSVISALIVISQMGYSSYGLVYRVYWNFSPFVLGIYSICCCIEGDADLKDALYKIYRIGMIVAICWMCFFMFRGAYSFVYRDYPIKDLTAEVAAGVHKGCLTTKQRAESIVALEKNLSRRTGANDWVLCFDGYACYMSLLCNGRMCNPSPLGIGSNNGFDYWHMYQIVPDKIFVCVNSDYSKRKKKLSHPIWPFITKYYKTTDSFEFETYDDSLELNNYDILEYEIADYEGAVEYADEMAIDILEF